MEYGWTIEDAEKAIGVLATCADGDAIARVDRAISGGDGSVFRLPGYARYEADYSATPGARIAVASWIDTLRDAIAERKALDPSAVSSVVESVVWSCPRAVVARLKAADGGPAHVHFYTEATPAQLRAIVADLDKMGIG